MIKSDKEKELFKKYQPWLHSDKPIPKRIIKEYNKDLKKLSQI